ncbi:unnamed protein product [Moneuplotes crassus]|uniref:Uncharacterized protein n=1 Tax=Euplotes crassus TaxID=5936 RepID=A0AAD1X937_EUPCR|nr:unnamed protein product [Moneuplotes crassus]
MKLLVNKKPSVKYGSALKRTLSISKKFDQVRIRKKLNRDYNVEATCYYRCQCKVCLMQTKQEYSISPSKNLIPVVKDHRNEMARIEQKDFLWIAEHLLSTHDRIHGCEILIPETYFFTKGASKLMIKSDKNNFLTSVKVPEKLDLTEIRKDLPQFTRNRMTAAKYSNDVNFDRSKRNKNRDLELTSKKPVDEDTKLYPHDYARVVYIPQKGKDPQIQLLGEKSLVKMFQIRKKANFWQTVMIMQSIVPYEINSKRRCYKYAFRIIHEEAIKRLDKIQFRCYNIFVKICFYLDTMYNYEIEEAEMEFLLDDEDQLWVIDIPKTMIRYKEGYEESTAVNGVTYCHPARKDPEQMMNKKDETLQYEYQDFMKTTSEIEKRIDNMEHPEQREKPQTSPFEKKYRAIFGIMMDQYKNLKSKYGFDEESDTDKTQPSMSKLSFSPSKKMKGIKFKNFKTKKASMSNKKRIKIKPLMDSLVNWGANRPNSSLNSRFDLRKMTSFNSRKRSIETPSTRLGTIIPHFRENNLWTPFNKKRNSLQFNCQRSGCFGKKRSHAAPSLQISNFPVKHFNIYS